MSTAGCGCQHLPWVLFSRPASFSPRSYFDRRCEVLQTDDGCDEESDIRQTRAVGRVRTGWLDVRPISWRVQKDKMDSSAPQDTVHIAAAQDTSHRPRSSSSGVRTKAGEPSAGELTGTQVGEAPPHRHKQYSQDLYDDIGTVSATQCEIRGRCLLQLFS